MIQPDVIVYLWMFPCFLFFIFPVLLSPVFLIMHLRDSRNTGLQNQMDSGGEQVLAEA